MRSKRFFSSWLLWLFVLNLGIAFGAGLYEALVELPLWIPRTTSEAQWNGAAAQAANSGLKFWAFVTTLPLTFLTLANLFASWKSKGDIRRWWLAASTVSLVERIFTFTYFIPTMIGLLAVGLTADPQVVATALLWEKMNIIRHLLSISSWLCALKAYSLLHR